MDLLKEIKSRYGTFSKGQKKIADYILSNYDKAAYLTAQKLGAAVGISESTVVRFASELGFEGYSEFIDRLQISVRNKLTALQRMEVAFDRLGENDILTNVLKADAENIRRSIEEINKKSFDACVSEILSARKIYIIGLRSSSVLANFLGLYLNMMFDNVITISTNSISEIFESMINVDSEDVVIAISYPRYSKRTVTTAQYAAKRGCKVIAITDCDHSPIIEYATHSLFARSDMAYFVDSLTAPFSLINALIVALGLSKKDALYQNFERLESLWEEYQVYEKYEEK